MGICISSASPEIHLQAENSHENGIYLGENISFNGVDEGLHCSLFSKQGSKGLNQDSAILLQGYGEEEGEFCGVFDGHGKNGHIVSKIVRNRLPSLLLSQKNSLAKMKTSNIDEEDEAVRNLVPNKNFHLWKEAFTSAFKVMDKEVKLQESLDCSSSGTTAVVVVKQGEDILIANLGDSRAVLGTISENEIVSIQLTTDLKPCVPSEAERIRNSKGRVLALKEEPHIQRVWLPHEDSPGLAMSRAIGDFRLKNHGVIALPDMSYRRLTSNDQFIVLASDGVWDVLSNDQVVSIVWGAAGSEQEAAKAVVEAATATWKKKFPSSKVDDCTAVCLFFRRRQRRQEANYENLCF